MKDETANDDKTIHDLQVGTTQATTFRALSLNSNAVVKG